MAVTLPNTFASKTTIEGADLDANFTALANKFAAAISSGDLSASAGILLSQLEASIEHMDVNLYLDGTQIAAFPVAAPAAGWPASDTMVAVPVIGLTGAATWVATDCYWVCNDTGGGTATFDVVWGEYNAAGAWSTVATVAAATITNAAGANDGNDGVAAMAGGGPVTLTVGAGPRSLAIVATGADATTMSAASGFFSATVRLRRAISTS